MPSSGRLVVDSGPQVSYVFRMSSNTCKSVAHLFYGIFEQRARTLSLWRVLTQRLHFKCLFLTVCVLLSGAITGHCAGGLRPTARAHRSPSGVASSTSSSSPSELLHCESATYMFLSSAFAVLFYLLNLVECVHLFACFFSRGVLLLLRHRVLCQSQWSVYAGRATISVASSSTA